MSTSILRQPHHLGPITGTSPGFWQRLWAGFERHGQRRAAAELRRLASHHVFSDPSLTRTLLAAADHAERG